jgi:hypothetical protein
MDPLQQQFECAVGDDLVKWLNARDGTSFVFQRRGDDAPDLIYEDQGRLLPIEVVAAYYDQAEASMQWQNARQRANAATSWSGMNFDEALAMNVIARIREKCAKTYGPNCVLLVAVRPPLTPMPDFQRLLATVEVPDHIPFTAIYVAGDFPATTHAAIGYFAWQLWPQQTQASVQSQ